MKHLAAALIGVGIGLGAAQAAEQGVHCHYCDEWNQPQAPFKVFGNTWYVGTAALSALLVTSPEGHVLLDAALPQSAAQIRKNIEALGFRLQDVKLILNSHPHYDHSGAIPELQRISGATVAASAPSKAALMAGVNAKDDPQYDPKDVVQIGKLHQVREIADGETLSVGPLRLTAHFTPGHTPGSTTWTWRSCEADVCRNIVYADSLNPISTDGFLYTGDATHPDISQSFRTSIRKVAALPCDVVVSVHPGFTNTFDKLKARTPASNPFVEENGCRKYAETAMQSLERRIEKESAQKR